MAGSRRGSSTQVASSIPFDNTDTEFESDNVQEAIEEIGISASPGFSFGRSGNLSNGTWLLNDGVPSNRTGKFIFLNEPELFQIFVSSENIDTYTITVYEHDGDSINLSVIDTLNVTSARGNSKQTSAILTKGKQIAIRITSGSAKNVVAGLVIKGKN